MSDGLVTDAVFLTRERQGDKGGRLEVGDGAVEEIEQLGSHQKGEVAEAEQGIQSVIGYTHVATRPVAAKRNGQEQERPQQRGRRACTPGAPVGLFGRAGCPARA